jgi:hypothetical protein
VDIERDHSEALISFPFRVAEMNELARRVDETIERLKIVRVVRDGRVIRHVRRIVHAPLHEALVVVEDLVFSVIRVRWREPYRQPTPRRAVLVPRLNLVRFDAGVCEAEWPDEIYPRFFLGFMVSLSNSDSDLGERSENEPLPATLPGRWSTEGRQNFGTIANHDTTSGSVGEIYCNVSAGACRRRKNDTVDTL